MTNTEFRSTLRQLGLSQGKLSRLLGVEPNTVSRWALGQLAVPQYAVAYLSLYAEVVELKERIAA